MVMCTGFIDPMSAPSLSISALEFAAVAAPDGGMRRAQSTQSGAPVPERLVSVAVSESVREPTRRPNEKNGMDKPSVEYEARDGVCRWDRLTREDRADDDE